jgi:hypothetical protein
VLESLAIDAHGGDEQKNWRNSVKIQHLQQNSKIAMPCIEGRFYTIMLNNYIKPKKVMFGLTPKGPREPKQLFAFLGKLL